ncbi:E3 SUMO-protein ligase ZNF451 isoform X2 [Colius striatus]|uniref:E3 SUMO-protein ligase ZNF451 isoform X2 n=1 Tax=Colius striatus TaxID=57412 RepID=UPI002B1E7C15|nr:E3 SUMO-protein ligase ZNF451 isoform X2 [Colius striatus]
MESHSSTSSHMSKSPTSESEDEIEFVGEGPLRPVLECIDLISSEDEEPNSSSYIHRNTKRKDHIDYQKERVASTLERLAHHVEVEKQQKEEKNKAFKEKVGSQRAHVLQELEYIRAHSDTEAARLCVDQWLKMPGPKPGTVNSGKRAICKRSGQTKVSSHPIACPVMHCNREFDNGPLLLGHLQRFDHSPCDPTVTLHGPPNEAVACVICCRRFSNSQQYSDHLLSKLKENDGHKKDVPPQHVPCFACPSCFLLFTERDKCLQHMSEKNHFQASKFSDEMKADLPLPFPSYAKNLLISLCKEVPFQVKCMSCRQILRSHMELTAHFRTRCYNSGPMAVAKKNISQVAEIFKTKGHCESCDKLFPDQSQIIQHRQATQHNIKVFTTMEESILMFCHINGRNKKQSFLCHVMDRSRPLLKRHLTSNEPTGEMEPTPSKQKSHLKDEKEDHVTNQSQSSACKVKAWFCECLQKFFTEDSVEEHILSANRICYKCAVCGKLAENASIIHLHMSRFHGGAHLNNFFLWCRACSVGLRKEDIMGHVTECHGGHSYYYEQEALEDEPMPSASDTACIPDGERQDGLSSPGELPPDTSCLLGKWQCRVCEEMFDSEDSVKQHCMSLESHAFHRYSCGLCRNHFRKVGTLQRHFQEHHNQEIQTKYFCGLCGNLFFDTEEEFLVHYKEIHSRDYTFVPEQMELSIKKEEDFLPAEEADCLSCGCRKTYISRINKRNDYVNCQKAMLQKGNLWFRCCICSATAQNFSDLKVHLNSHTPLKRKEEMYVVRCAACNKNFDDLQSAHQHYHVKHCFLQKPDLSSLAPESENKVFKFTASEACVDRKSHKLKFQASPSKTQEGPQSPTLQGPRWAKKEKGNLEYSEEPDGELPDLDYLRTMTHIVLVDLDNWGSFFMHLPANLNQGTFVWGFQGGQSNWKPPVQCKSYNSLKRIGCFFLHPRCGTRREAADFALCVHAGRLDEHLPKQIPFTILSGDKSFLELESQFKMTQRSAHILNPHHIKGDMMCALLNSISDTTKGSDSEEDEDMKLTMQRSLEEARKQEEQDADLQEAIKRSLEEM